MLKISIFLLGLYWIPIMTFTIRCDKAGLLLVSFLRDFLKQLVLLIKFFFGRQRSHDSHFQFYLFRLFLRLMSLKDFLKRIPIIQSILKFQLSLMIYGRPIGN